MQLQKLFLFWEPFCQRSEPPRKDPPGSSCSPLLQTCLLLTAQTHRPLVENTSGRFYHDWLCTAAMTLPVYIDFQGPVTGESSYSGECPQLCTPSVTVWPSEGSLQQAAADCSQCRRGHRLSPSSLPAIDGRDDRPVSCERQWAAAGTVVKFACGGGEKDKTLRKCVTVSCGMLVVPEARPQSPPQTG